MNSESAKPLVSILIRSMNIPYLHTALQSAGEQTYPNIEIIVVNASGKPHKPLDPSICNCKIHFIDSNIPLPRSKAANIALTHANGVYALLLDDDDWIDANHIENLVHTLQHDENAILSYTGTRVINENGIETGVYDFDYDQKQIYAGNFIPIHSVLFRTKVFTTLGCCFDENLDLYEDWDFWMQLAQHGNFKRTEGISANYRIEEGGRSGVQTLQISTDTRIQIFKKWQSIWNTDVIVYLAQEAAKSRNFSQIIYERDTLVHEKNILTHEKEALTHEKNILAAELQSMLHSKSWKATKPLRDSMHVLKKGAMKIKSIFIYMRNILIFIKLNRNELISKTIKGIRRHGIKGLLFHVANIGIDKSSYTYTTPLLTDDIQHELKELPSKPLISIIMPVYNVDPIWLDLAIKSIEAQWYEHWELCITDDKSTNEKTTRYLKSLKNPKIKITYLDKNLNISGASNEALKLASGEYIALMDNDDELTPDALYEVVKTINEQGAEFIYSDEDKLEMDGSFSTPHFKPDFAPDMFLSQNYISHLSVIKKGLIDKAEGFEIGLEGAQDYDLYLKVFEHTDRIVHIPKVLYHWRKIPGSTASDFGDKLYAQTAGCAALGNALNRRGVDALVSNGKYDGTYQIRYELTSKPLVSIIIPFKDKPELLKMCIESILKKTNYPHFEIIGISNNSNDKATFDEMDRLKNIDERVSFYEYNVPFNYSKINNYAVDNYARGEQIILLNNDIEIITSEWVERLLEFSQREDVGVVGAKLYYPNNTLQHAGVIVGLGGVAGHSHKYFEKNHPGYFYRLFLVQNLSGVTAACCMVKKSIFTAIGGLNENDLAIAFNDVDFCLRVREEGYLNIFTPYCEAYHHESISRGHEDTVEKQERFNSEIYFMQNRHKSILENGDPYYNINLTLDREDFSLKELQKYE